MPNTKTCSPELRLPVKPDDYEVPPPDEQDAFFAWVMAQADAESEGTPETLLINGPDESTLDYR